MAELQIFQFPCLRDNFGVLIHDADQRVTASIDAPDAGAVSKALEQNGWELTHILVTHHHHDHVGGNKALKEATGCTIAGPAEEAEQIPGLDVALGDGDNFQFGSFTANIFETPGHTTGHITYWFPEPKVAFTGDTLFALGCGRLFEGSAETMWESLNKIMGLPPETAVYCGHEYTLSNGEFALTIEPENEALCARVEDIRKLHSQGKATLPTSVQLELDTNPFLRASSPAIRERLGMQDRPDADVFAEIRARKDQA